ncbi:MAG TPA: DUF2586 family protein [Chryseolinea sp.]|nr:DUF2586 family protein [Chryseolinea sp.]
MALSKISIVEQEGSNRILTSEDNKSGLLFYVSSNPLTGDTFQVFSIQEVEGYGITSTSLPVPHYHLSEFYRVNDSGQLQVRFADYPTGGTHTFEEVKDLVSDCDGDLSQVGIYTKRNLSSSMVTALQDIMTELKEELDIPLVSILQANTTGMTLQSLPDLSSNDCPQVAVTIGQDGGNKGFALYNTQGYSVGILGAALGALASSSVHESISWKGQFDMPGSELNTLAFSNGVQYKLVTKTQQAQLNDKKYIFLLKDYGLNGSFFNSSFVANSEASDYYSLERNRVINKARKLLRTALLPELNSPLYLDDDGKLRIETVGKFTSKCEQALDGMRRLGEVSNYRIYINPNQDVLSDDTLHIDVKIQPVGVARFINITLGFAVSLA